MENAVQKMLMLYFSGTGNSKYIAEAFGEKVGCGVFSIEDRLDFDRLITQNAIIAFSYPIYGSRVPRIMREFVARHIEALKDKKLIIFCTQMAFSGDGARVFCDLFPRGQCKVIYAEHFVMPNNVNNLFIFPITGEKFNRSCLKYADKKLDRIVKNIASGKERRKGFNIVSRLLGLMQGAFLPLWEEPAKRRVWVHENCTLCGLCVSRCPMNNLEIIEDKVVTKNNCTCCYRCTNICPQKAISIFFEKKIKRQYKGFEL